MKKKYSFSHIIVLAILCVWMAGCHSGRSSSSEDTASIISKFEEVCCINPDWKLESDDHNLTIYTTQDSIESCPSMCLVVCRDGDDIRMVSEDEWRDKYHFKRDEPCPLFSNGHRKLFTIDTAKGPIYVLVTEELLEDEYVNLTGTMRADGMCVYVHAYTIQDHQLRTSAVFQADEAPSDIIKCDTTLWVEWVHDVPSVWPARYDDETKTLEIAKVYPSSSASSMVVTKEIWKFSDDELFHLTDDEPFVTEHLIGDMDYTVAMTEKFPKHKVQINHDGNCGYQYASWPAASDWSTEPSFVVGGGEKSEADGSFHFKSKDGYEYVVYPNPTPEGPWPGLSALEVRKDGKIITREEADY